MNSAKLYKPTGEVTDILPANGTNFTMKKLYAIIGTDIVECLTCAREGMPKMLILCDEEGKFKKDNPVNETATAFRAAYYGYTDVIVGTVVICTPNYLK